MHPAIVRPSGCPIEIVAHRGASKEAPENTLAAVELAWALEADAVEIDVRLSGDGRLAVIHDATLNRTASVEGCVGEMSMPELRNVDVGAWKGERWRGETISELPKILATIPTGRRLFVELKNDDRPESQSQIIDALYRDLTQTSVAPDAVVLISFHPDLLRAAKQRLPEFKAFLVVQQEPVVTEQNASLPESAIWSPTIKEIIDVAVSSGFDGVDLSNTAALTRDVISSIRRAQLSSCVWTVNSIDDARRLVEAGIDSLTTDDPRHLRAALRQQA